MRKLFWVLVSVASGFVFAVLFLGLCFHVHAGGGPNRETRVPGDTNCDGNLDLSDAITILNFLYTGTSGPPCPIADPPELVARVKDLENQVETLNVVLQEKEAMIARFESEKAGLEATLAEKDAALNEKNSELIAAHALAQENENQLSACTAALEKCNARTSFLLPDTGQTKCYGPDGTATCETCAGQDGFYKMGCPSDGRFLDNKDGTVTDNCTGLMWQKETADTTGDGKIDAEDAVLWCEALEYCENLNFRGHDDWRLPNVRELQSIVDYELVNPSIDPVFGALQNTYWSSTSGPSYPGSAFIVNFQVGSVSDGVTPNGGGNKRYVTFYVRAVRSGP